MALPPVWPDSPRDATCQREVGGWGDAADSAEDYDGGHLLAYQLGGWSGRANLVPQAASFNRGNWAQVENALARCGSLQDRRLIVEIAVDYPDPYTLVPVTMRMRLEDGETGLAFELVFDNAERGGPYATEHRERAVAWLRGLGCL